MMFDLFAEPLNERYSRVWRAARKAIGLTQKELSVRLGCPQQRISEIERGRSFGHWPQLLEFTKLTGITVEDLETGYIHKFGTGGLPEPREKLSFQEKKSDLNFSFSDEYAGAQGSSTWNFRVLLNYSRRYWGYKKTSFFFQQRGFDEDYLVFSDRLVSIRLWAELATELAKQGILFGDRNKDRSTLSQLSYNTPEALGQLFTHAQQIDQFPDLVRERVEQVYERIECNHIYKVSSDPRYAFVLEAKVKNEVLSVYEQDPVTEHIMNEFKCCFLEDLVMKTKKIAVQVQYRKEGRGNCVFRASLQ